MEHEILEGTHEHIDEVLGLWEKSMEFHQGLDYEYFSEVSYKGCYFAAKIEDYINSTHSTLFVLLVDGEVCGFVLAGIETKISLYNSTKYCNIEDVMVDESVGGRGYGKMLMDKGMEWGRVHGAEKVKLFVHAYNHRAVALYHDLGFQSKLFCMERTLEKLPYPEQQPDRTKKDNTETLVSPEQLESLLPLAFKWAEQQERFILEHGVPLDREYRNLASSIGVKDIGRVRLLKVDEIPAPANPHLKAAAEVLGLIGKHTLAITYNHGIYIRADHWYNKNLVVHELCHTMQYERLGGIQPFLEQYLSECLSVGYTNGKLEQEAVMMERIFSK